MKVFFILAKVYPNPFSNNFSVFLKKKCLGDVLIALEYATGKTIFRKESAKPIDAQLINWKF
jgi:hypothetical protein